MFTRNELFSDGYGLCYFHDAAYNGDLKPHCEQDLLELFDSLPEDVQLMAQTSGFRDQRFCKCVFDHVLQKTMTGSAYVSPDL